MPVVLRNLYIKYEFNTTLEKVVARAMSYEADAYCSKEMSIKNIN